MTRIVLTQPLGLTDGQLATLKKLGEVQSYDTVCANTAEWLERVKDADIIYTNHHGFDEGWKSLHDVFVTLPFVGVHFLDKETLKKNNVVVSKSPGCNQIAVSEWIVGMILSYSRRLPELAGSMHFDEPTPFYTSGIFGKSACVIGRGYIGNRTGQFLQSLGMNVSFYTRNDVLEEKIKHADYIVDCLSLNPTSVKFYNENFFAAAKDGVVFVSVSSGETKDTDAVLNLLANGKICHYITDNAQAKLFDTEDETYRALLNNPRITITPHVAAYTENTRETASKMCIENVRAYLAGSPINLI